MKHTHLRSTDDRDDACLNFFWMYGSRLITKEQFTEGIDKIKYDITQEYWNKEKQTENKEEQQCQSGTQKQ